MMFTIEVNKKKLLFSLERGRRTYRPTSPLRDYNVSLTHSVSVLVSSNMWRVKLYFHFCISYFK